MSRTARKIQNPVERLTVQESRFVIEYIKDGNGSRSALDCGLCPSGNKGQAANTATLLLKRPQVLAAVHEQLNASAARTLITVDRILQELYRGATYNVQEAFNADGSCKPITELSEDLARAIEGFDTEEIRGKPGHWVTKYRFAKKSVAQQILLERIDNVVKRFEVSGPGGVPLSQAKVDLSDVSTELLKRIVEKGG